MTTASTLITRARTQLLGPVVERRNKLSTGINASSTTVYCTYDVDQIGDNSIIEVGSELMLVWDVDETNKALTVERGWDGTTAATHDTNDIVTVSPRFPRAGLLQALNDELADLSASRLFKTVTVEVTYTGATYMQNVTSASAVQKVLQVFYRDTTNSWIEVSKWRLARQQNTSEFASGFAIRFDEDIPVGPVRITYATDFVSVTEAQDVTTVGGLPATCEDIVVYGIQLRAIAPKEVARNFIESEGDTRRADEVGAGAIMQSTQAIARLRRDRIQAEAARLIGQYPLRTRM